MKKPTRFRSAILFPALPLHYDRTHLTMAATGIPAACAMSKTLEKRVP